MVIFLNGVLFFVEGGESISREESRVLVERFISFRVFIFVNICFCISYCLKVGERCLYIKMFFCLYVKILMYSVICIIIIK